MKSVVVGVIFLLVFSACGGSDVEEPEPTANMDGLGYVWMMPKKGTFTEFMTQLDQWPQTLGIIDIIGFADHRLFNDYSAEEREAGFAVMNEVGLSLAMEVGALKEWARTGTNTFNAQKPTWEVFIEEGANIAGIVLDEPLVNVTIFPNIYDLEDDEARFEYAVEETAEFMRLVREDYPDWFIACIEAFPFFSADYVIRWIDALEARLAAKGVRGQEFFRLDVDWNAFGKNYTNALGESSLLTWEQGWLEVKRIEDHCRSIGLPFSLIYWAASLPASQILIDDPAGWYKGIVQMGEGYRDAGGRPDQYVIQTWIEINGVGFPEKTLPETDPHSFTYSIVEFNRQFIPVYPHGGNN